MVLESNESSDVCDCWIRSRSSRRSLILPRSPVRDGLSLFDSQSTQPPGVSLILVRWILSRTSTAVLRMRSRWAMTHSSSVAFDFGALGSCHVAYSGYIDKKIRE